MALSKAADFRELSDEDLTAEIAKVKRDLFDLRFKKATRQMETGFHEFKHTRRKLAQLMTIERERQTAAKADASATVTAEATKEA
ncbi:MAG: 50S ribosomal protein L29 [Cyanobacteria bacterium P01_D01_bin.105]